MLTNERMQELERDAGMATPGPWKREFVICITCPEGDWVTIPKTEKDAQHIANCDPQTVMELVKMARRYLWLRDKAPVQSGRAPMVLNVECIPKTTWRDQLMGEQLDATIDQFIEEGESDE